VKRARNAVARSMRPAKVVVACILLALVGSAATLAEGASAEKFCRPEVIRDYQPPLKTMKPLHHPPSGGSPLPFGAKGLELLPVGFSHVSAGGGKIGFFLDGGAGTGGKRISWGVNSELSLVAQDGRVISEIGKRIQRPGSLKSASSANIVFEVGKAPRFYRIDVTFLGAGGKSLAHYAEYFRVVPRTLKARLGLERKTYTPGDRVAMRMENLGTVDISYGYEFAVEIWMGSAWAKSDVSLPGWPEVGLGLGGGRSAECQRLPITQEFMPGKYRLSKQYGIGPGGPFPYVVRAVFDVSR
jgi:hypothetical protein